MSNYYDLYSLFFFLNHMHLFKVQREHAPRHLFSSRLKYLQHLAKLNIRVWSLFHHDTLILTFHLGHIFK